jgi:alpha,alpha-trehalase
MRATLQRLAGICPVTIVSGRGRDDVTQLVGLDTLTYAGSHGFDIAGSATGTRLEVQPGLEPVIADAAAELQRRTGHIRGALVENKKFAAAVHFRLVSDAADVAEIERAVDDIVAARPQLRKALGKKVFEVRPAMEWDKGRAVLWLLRALDLDSADVIPLYIGDDVTDEDAFAALHQRGIGVLVAEIPRPTAAHYSVQDIIEVRELLRRIAACQGA